MQSIAHFLQTGSRSLSIFLGVLVLVAALATSTTEFGLNDITDWILRVLGSVFLGLLSLLVFVTLFCWVRLIDACHNVQSGKNIELWLDSGLHAANGVSTLALTFTLLGISLGIGTLADQKLNPSSVQTIIRGLTEHFSLAFMTTVVGLPLAALLRALISITHVRLSPVIPIPSMERRS